MRRKKKLFCLWIVLVLILLTGCTAEANAEGTSTGEKQESVALSENGTPSAEIEDKVKTPADNGAEVTVNAINAGADAADRKTVVGISFPSDDESGDRWSKDGVTLSGNLEEAGYGTSVYYGKDVSKQKEQIRLLIKEGVEILIVAPVDHDGLEDEMNLAAEEKITVISYDDVVMNTDVVDYYVMFHHYMTGSMQGAFVQEHFPWNEEEAENVSLGLYVGDPEDLAGIAMYQGVEDEVILSVDREKIFVMEQSNDFPKTDILIIQQCRENLEEVSGENSEFESENEKQELIWNDECFVTGICRSHGQRPTLSGEKMIVYQDTRREVEVAGLLVKALLAGETISKELTETLPYKCYYDRNSYDNGTGIIPGFLIEPEEITGADHQKNN